MPQVEGSYEAAAAYERDQKRTAPPNGGAMPPPQAPGAAFSRMKAAFERDTGAKTDGGKVDLEPGKDEGTTLRGMAILAKMASVKAAEAAATYLELARAEKRSTAPGSFMDTVALVLETSSEVLSGMADEYRAEQEPDKTA